MSEHDERLKAADVLLIVLAGALLGIAYNALLLQASPARAVTWVTGMELPRKVVKESGSGMSLRDSIPALEPPVHRLDPAQDTPGEGVPQIADSREVTVVRLDAARRFQAAGAALFVDARTPDEYAAGHIAGAVNLPLEVLVEDRSQAQALATGGRPIITYCDGPRCMVALDLAKTLVEDGQHRVLAFETGFPAWKTAGLPVHAGARP
jgi:rhodanese-related sulfurtransferase